MTDRTGTNVECLIPGCPHEARYRTRAHGGLPAGLDFCAEHLSDMLLYHDGVHTNTIMATAPECDFCCEPDVWWVLHTTEPVVVETIATKTDGTSKSVLNSDDDLNGWAACNDCRVLVDAHDLDGLVDRSLGIYLQRHPDSARHRVELRAAMRVLQGRALELGIFPCAASG